MPAPSKQQRRLAPELRFQEFEGEWKEVPMKDVFQEVNESVGEREIDTYSITAGYGFVSQKEKFGRNISGQQNSRYTVLDPGQFTYNKGNSKTYKYGCIYENTLEKPIAVPNVFISFEFIDKKMVSSFFAKLFESHYLDRGLRRIISSSARMDGLLNVSKASFFKLTVKYPKPSEQQKIADFLTAVDAWIQNLQQQKEALEVYKKGMMQKIFSQEIRFKDENGEEFPEWVESTLEDCLDYEQPTDYIVRNTDYNNNYPIPVLTAGKSFILGYTNEVDGIFRNEAPVIIFDDFTTANKYVKFPFKVKSSAMKILKGKEGVDIKYVYEAMQQIQYQVGGHGRQWISKFSKLQIPLPSLAEQQKISSFSTELDAFIKIKQFGIKKAEQWKQGLLQQLFV